MSSAPPRGSSPPFADRTKACSACCKSQMACCTPSTSKPVSKPSTPVTFYTKPLPAPCIPFSSPEGKAIFAEALADGKMEGYFKLAEQLRTQDDPAFCGLASLAMCLNALGVDPKRPWKGPWRWFTERLLDCCEPLEVVRRDGIVFSKVACVARCNGAEADEHPHGTFSLEEFREAVVRASESPAAHGVLLLSYSRKGLGQAGDGHFSPCGGYSRSRDMLLIMDTATFKYGIHWARVEDVYKAMSLVDPATGRPRGYMWIRKRPDVESVLFTLGVQDEGWDLGMKFLNGGSLAAAEAAAQALERSEAWRASAGAGWEASCAGADKRPRAMIPFRQGTTQALRDAAAETVAALLAALPISGLNLVVSRLGCGADEPGLGQPGLVHCTVPYEQRHHVLFELRSCPLFRLVEMALGVPEAESVAIVPRPPMVDVGPDWVFDEGYLASSPLVAERATIMLLLLPAEVWARFPGPPLQAALRDLVDLDRDSRSLLRAEVGYCRAQMEQLGAPMKQASRASEAG